MRDESSKHTQEIIAGPVGAARFPYRDVNIFFFVEIIGNLSFIGR